jgi:hypothetical protein
MIPIGFYDFVEKRRYESWVVKATTKKQLCYKICTYVNKKREVASV